MARNQAALNRLMALYSGADAGHFTLPDELRAARSSFEAVMAADVAARSSSVLDPQVLETRALDAIFDAAKAGRPLFDPAKPPQWTIDLLEARKEQEQRAAEARVLSEAAERAAARLTSTVGDLAAITIEDHLRPALEAVIEGVERLRPRATGLPWEQPERVIGMPSAIRSAWDAMTQASTRYLALRAAHDMLWRLIETPDTGLWRFIECRSLQAVWPAFGSWQQQGVPWPHDPRARLLWLVERREQVGLWMPTPDEARAAMAAQAKVLNQRLAGIPVSAGY